MSITYHTLVINENDEELKINMKNHNVNYIKDVGMDLYVPKELKPGEAYSFKIGLGIKAFWNKKYEHSSYELYCSSMGEEKLLYVYLIV